MMSNELAERLKQAAADPSRMLTVTQLQDETRRRRHRQAFGGSIVALVAVAGLVAGLISSGGSGTDRQNVAAVSSAPPAAGPTITATPSNGLLDGQTIVVHGSGFTPQAQIAMVTCGVESKTLANKQDACAVGQAQYVYADPHGIVSARYVVQRTIETATLGKIDCASAPARCRLGVGEIKTQHGASVLLSFSSQVQAVTTASLSLARDSAGRVINTLTPELSGKGFGANQPVDIRQCLANTDCGAFPVVRTVTTDNSGDFTTQLSLQLVIQSTTGDDVWCGLHCNLVATVQANSYQVVASTPEFSVDSLLSEAKSCDLATMTASFAGWTSLDNGDRLLTIKLRNGGPTDCALLGFPSVQATKAGRVVSGEKLVGGTAQTGVILNSGGTAQFQVVVSDCGIDPSAFDSLKIGLFGATTQRTVAVPAQPARTKVGYCLQTGLQNLQVKPFTLTK